MQEPEIAQEENIGRKNGIEGFHENLLTFKRPKLPDF